MVDADATVTVFHDPLLPHGRPSLISDLLTVPATPGQHQLENQATTVLAWLVDRSPAFADAFVRLFLGDGPEAGEPVAARTQVSLPKPGGGALRPDLSVCVGDRHIQLLVEVKVDAAMSTYSELEGVDQVEAYRILWARLSDGEAEVRAVGALTRTGSRTVVDMGSMVAREVSWRELRDEIDQMLVDDALEPPVAQVAASLVEAIDTRIAPRALTEAELLAFYQQHHPVLDEIRTRICDALDRAGPARRIKGEAYDGWRVPVGRVDGEPMFLRLYIAPAYSRLNLKGAPDALIVGPERDSGGTLGPDERHRADAVGFPAVKDVSGGLMHRRLWKLRRIDPAAVTEDIVNALVQARFAARRPTKAKPTPPEGDFSVTMSAADIGAPLGGRQVCAYPGHLSEDFLWPQWVLLHATRHGDDVSLRRTMGVPIDLAYALAAVRAARVFPDS